MHSNIIRAIPIVKAYHILLIDNNKNDIDFIEAKLNKHDIDLHINIIQTGKRYFYSLDNKPPNLVISLPALSGTSALRIVRNQHPQLPFILIDGSIGEEKAVDIMLEGSSVYATKDNPERLGTAVKRELQNYEQHVQKQHELEQAKKRQKKAERQCDKAYKIARIGHSEIDFTENTNGTIYWSDATQEIHEINEDFQPTVVDSISFIAPRSQELVINTFKEATSGTSYDHEIVIRTGKGNKRWVRNISQAEFKEGECARVYRSFQNLTDRKISEKNYRDIFDLSPQSMWVYDSETLKFLDVNRVAINHYGYSYKSL